MTVHFSEPYRRWRQALLSPKSSIANLVMSGRICTSKNARCEPLRYWLNNAMADVVVVDILLNANGYAFEALQPYTQTLDLDGIPVKTVDLQGLLLTKERFEKRIGWIARSLSGR